MSGPGKLSGVLRFLYTQNPFYAISAGLILYGIYAAFSSDASRANDPWLLALSLCGYTSLMAVVAVLVVRLGKVWEDARSIVLILLFQFAAISMSFDRICAVAPREAAHLLLFGFAFSVIVTEGLIYCLGLRFPGLFRGPYYALLGLFFFYPLCVSPGGVPTSVSAISWRIYLFPALAGVVFLTLIPAVRRGAAYVVKNGTPWTWPWYPWTVFGFLALAVGLRSYVLAYSFSLMGMRNAFGCYYLAPFLLALLLLLSEIAVKGGYRRLQSALMICAPVILLLSIPWRSHDIYIWFLRNFTESVGSPIWLTTLGLTGFYAYAWWRRLPASEFSLLAVLGLACCVGRGTVGWSTLASPAWWPLVVIAAWQAHLAMQPRNTLRGLVAALSLVAASAVAWRDTPYLAMHGAIPAHLALACVLLMGLISQNRLIRLLCRLSSLLVAAAVVIVVTPLAPQAVPDAIRLGYVVLLSAVAGVWWYLLRDRWWLYTSLVEVGASGGFAACWVYWQLEASVGSSAMLPLASGVAFLIVAAAISAAKGGDWRRLRKRLRLVFADEA
jgi:hypothetical protein